MGLYNINEYKRAQQYVKDIEKILKVINATDTSLRSYEKYRPVQAILTTIMAEKSMLEIFLEQNKIVVKTKGQRR